MAYKLIAYIAVGEALSTEFLTHYRKLPQQFRDAIGVVNIDALAADMASRGEQLPQYLDRNFMPCLVTNEQNPTVQRRQRALDTIRAYVQQAQQTNAGNTHGKMLSDQPEMPSDATVNHGAYASTVDPSLYEGKIAAPSSRAPSGKITAEEMAAFNRDRENSEAVRRRQEMAGRR